MGDWNARLGNMDDNMNIDTDFDLDHEFFIGHKRVTEYFVAIIAKRPGWHDNREKDRDLTFIEPEPSQCYNARGSHGGSTNTPKTSVPDFPFASVEVDADGRVSPRLPIMSKRGSSIGSTPSSALHRDA